MVTWELFLDRFRARFLSNHWRQRRADEFHDLKQLSMSVEQYERRFYELKQYAGISHDEGMLVQHFVRGLNARISDGVRVFEPKMMEMAVEKARLVEENLAMALGGHIGVQIGSAPTPGFSTHGGQSQGAGASRNMNPPSKGGQQRQQQQHQEQQSQPKHENFQSQQGGNSQFRRDQNRIRHQVRHERFAHPAPSFQSALSRASFQQSNFPSEGRGFGRGTGCYSCGQHRHIARLCPQKSTSGFNQRPAASEPTVGDASRSHRVFSVVDNRQAGYQDAGVEASGRG